MSFGPRVFQRLVMIIASAGLCAATWFGAAQAQQGEGAAEAAPGATPAGASPKTLIDDEASARRADAIANNLMSPFCPGRTLAGCPSPNAAAWRSDIRQWVDDGLTTKEIEQRLTQRNPEFNLHGSPETALGGWLAVFLGLVALAVLAGVLRMTTRRAKQDSEEQPSSEAKPSKAQPKNDSRAAKHDGTDAELDERLKNELEALD